ncbi:MAG: hypothetical protein HS132_18805 [Planctomycetia bacterium]|nr:hypothetical protein [Planctomycetia bacterium]
MCATGRCNVTNTAPLDLFITAYGGEGISCARHWKHSITKITVVPFVVRRGNGCRK